MTTLLDKSLKRELGIGPDHFTLTISPDGLKLVPKGKRNGVELKWLDLVSGQAALAVALNASLAKLSAFPASKTEEAPPKSTSTTVSRRAPAPARAGRVTA